MVRAHLLWLGLGTAALPASPRLPAPWPESTVDWSQQLDPRAIAAHAIRRRREVLAGIRDARFQVYAKFAVRDLDRPANSESSMVLVAESHRAVSWRPGFYQETILAHRQSNGGGLQGVAAVVDIANFGRNRIELEEFASASRRLSDVGSPHGSSGRTRVVGPSIPLPIAEDALRHYDYQVVDAHPSKDGPVIRLAVVPRSKTSARFEGTIDVVDSTWDIVALDLEIADSHNPSSVVDLRYRVRYRDSGGNRWLPCEVNLTGEIRPRISGRRIPRRIAGIELPGVPRHLAFEQTAVLDSFRVDEGYRPDLGAEYRLVLDPAASHAASDMWPAIERIPLTPVERAAFARADSSRRRTGLVPTVARVARTLAGVAGSPGFTHYNRVDGVFLGLGTAWRATPWSILTTKGGYALGSEAWQYQLGGKIRVLRSRPVWVGADFHDLTASRPTLFSNNYNPSLRAFFAHSDPLDYYRDRGFGLSVETRPADFIHVDLGYTDTRQSSLDTVPGFSLFSARRRTPTPNPPIAAGHLRSVSASLVYDSRTLRWARGVDSPIGDPSWTRIALATELAVPSLIPTDFAFHRYTIDVRRTQRTGGLGSTSVAIVGALVTGNVPPQRYLTVDFGMGFLARDGIGFRTLDRSSFSGDRVAMISVDHDFDPRLFAKSGLPLIRSIPFTLSLNGGVFWTRFAELTPGPTDTLLRTAPQGYREIGFSLGNLTPFLAPFNFAAQFTWQLSGYPTRNFRFGFGLTRS